MTEIFNASGLTCTIFSQAALFFLKFIPQQRRRKYQNHPDLALESSRVYLNECLTLRAIFTNIIFLFIAKPQVEKKTKSRKKEWSGRLRLGVTDHVIVFVFADRSYSSKKMISTPFQKKILKSAWLWLFCFSNLFQTSSKTTCEFAFWFSGEKPT